MYQSIRVQRFRCFRDLTVSDLAPVNLITGRNNVGKTTLLEALYLHCGATNPELALRVQSFRGLEVGYSYPPTRPAPWDFLYHNMNRSLPIEISSVDANGLTRSLKFTVLEKLPSTVEHSDENDSHPTSTERIASTQFGPWGLNLEFDDGTQRTEYKLILSKEKPRTDDIPPPPFPTVFIYGHSRGGAQEDVERFSRLSIERRTESVIEAMRIIEPRLRDLSVNIYLKRPAVWADIGLAELLPVQLLGDGVSRVLNLMTTIAMCQDGVVLIDEIDAGLHHSKHGSVIRALMEFALRVNVQIFATTHSHEFLVAAREAAREFTIPVLRLHRLDRVGDDIEAVTYDDEALEGAIAADLEVRS